MAAEEAIPGFEPGGQVSHDMLRFLAFVFLFRDGLEQWRCMRGRE